MKRIISLKFKLSLQSHEIVMIYMILDKLEIGKAKFNLRPKDIIALYQLEDFYLEIL